MTSQDLSVNELARYARHFPLPNFGIEGQKKLKSASVLVVGAGGLGSPLIQYLAAAGIGKLGIADFDVVDESNLQRQTLFGTADIGNSKAEVAWDWVKAINPYVEVEVYPQKITSSNALQIFEGYSVVADGTDNFPTRYLINDACGILDIPNVYASIYQYEGQLSVFNASLSDGSLGPNYRDIFPSPPPTELVPNCAEGGVLGVLPGIMGSLQANEVIKLITGIGECLIGKLLIFDSLTVESRIMKLKPGNPKNRVKALIDYEDFCGITSKQNTMKEFTVEEFDQMRKAGESFTLIDVREANEVEIANIGGTLIPMGTVQESVDSFRAEHPVIIYCRSGKRSGNVVKFLEQNHGLTNLYNLKGGVLDWADKIDPTMTKY